MTIYESLNNDIDNLRKAGDTCMGNGKTEMAIVWYTHAAKLVDIVDNIPVDFAGCVVV